MNYPNLHHLKYLVDAVDLGSVSAAAEKNLVSHPAISRAIQAIEQQFGVEVLVHKKRMFEVTDEGRKLCLRAKLLLEASGQLLSSNEVTEDAPAERLSLGLSRTLAQAYLGSALKKLSLLHPHACVDIRLGTTHEILAQVSDHALDLGFTIGTQASVGVRSKRIGGGHFVLIRSSRRSADSKKFSSLPFLLTEARTETEKFRQAYNRQFGKNPGLRYQVRSWDTIVQLVEAGVGIGSIPDLVLKSNARSNVTEIKASWFKADYDIYVSQSKNRSLNSAAQAVVDLISTGL